MAWEERGLSLKIFRTRNRGWNSRTFTNDEAKALLRKSVDHLLTYSGRQIAVGSQKPSGIMRQKTRCASESNTAVRVVFANRSGFDAPIGVVLAWEERGSCLNLFRTTNCDRISENFTNYEAKDLLRKSCLNIFRTKDCGWIAETFTNYEAKDLLRKSVDHLLTYSGRQIAVASQKPSRIMRQKTCCASESNTSVRVVFANQSGFDAPIGVFLAWEERGSCLNVFQMTNRGRISETFTNYEANHLLRKNVDHVLTYSGRQIAVGSQKPSRITRQKPCGASESNTSVRVVFANRSGFDAPIGVVLAWEERGSCLNIFRTTNRGQISETFKNYEAKDLLRKVDHVLTYSGRQITVRPQKPSRITRQKACCTSESNRSVRVVFLEPECDKSRSDLRKLHELRGKRLVAQERRSCLNLIRTRNRGRLSETITNYEAKDLLRKSVDHVLTYFGRQIAVGSQKTSRITRQKTCCASESNTSVRVVYANRSGFDALIGVVFAWEERGSCLNKFRMTSRCRISETLTNYEAKDLLRNRISENFTNYEAKRLVAQGSQTCRFALYLQTGVVLMLQLESSWHGRNVDHVLTYSGRQIGFGSQKPSPITRQKTCYASESNTLVRVVFANRSSFDAPIGVVLAW
ncbi:uncharacterized protein G2W53_026240 [Senna tora]|uniref:Uncharacterized protein n=1 Tax=Senna tora TaxID=362788 RepID=A0A834TFF3_9FABA|nr:uncharacterized protein G2W53_026240 [Senna tora]